MDALANLSLGLGVALSFQNLLYCLLGVVLGTLIGVLPGLGPVTTIAMLLPITFYLPPVAALIMLAGIYYGAQYGGSTTAILVNIPGEASSVVTAIDGHALARKGEAGAALAIAALASFFAGMVCVFVIALLAPLLASMVLSFGAAEYFSLIVLGLVASIVLARGSLVKASGMLLVGMILGLVGTDINSGTLRYTFGVRQLSDGIDFVVVAMGVFGFGEIIRTLEQHGAGAAKIANVARLGPSRAQLRAAAPAIARGTLLGSLLGVLPGGGAILASFSAYMLEKKIAKDPSRFGNGAIEGVAAPEAANNAGAQTSFIPMLTLGIPPNAVMALMIGAMAIHGIRPGPLIMSQQPDLFWGMIASMWIGNMMLLVLNLPLVGLWARLLSIPYRLLYPSIVLLCCVGIYSLESQTLDLLIGAIFGIAAYLLAKVDCDPTPLLLGLILSPALEENLRRALLLSNGDLGVFVQRPISLTLLLVVVTMIALSALPALRAKREEAFQE